MSITACLQKVTLDYFGGYMLTSQLDYSFKPHASMGSVSDRLTSLSGSEQVRAVVQIVKAKVSTSLGADVHLGWDQQTSYPEVLATQDSRGLMEVNTPWATRFSYPVF